MRNIVCHPYYEEYCMPPRTLNTLPPFSPLGMNGYPAYTGPYNRGKNDYVEHDECYHLKHNAPPPLLAHKQLIIAMPTWASTTEVRKIHSLVCERIAPYFDFLLAEPHAPAQVYQPQAYADDGKNDLFIFPL